MSKELLEQKIVEQKLIIDKYLQANEGQMKAYKALPHMQTLNRLMEEYEKQEGIEYEVCCMIYSYLAEGYTFVPYMPLAAENYKLACIAATKSTDETVRGEIPELFYKAVKIRNIIAKDIAVAGIAILDFEKIHEYKVYDPCLDLLDTIKNEKNPELDRLFKAAVETACRSLLADKVEHTPEYLNVIAKVNEELEVNLADTPKGVGFCHTYWAAKKVCLKKYGITWTSPAILNKNVKFD